MSSPELVFIHIPKTAGTSQHALFNRFYGKDHVFWIGEHCPGKVDRYPKASIAGRALVGGHKPLSFYPRLSSPLYSAVVRDPLARAVSLFTYHARPDLARSLAERAEREALLESLLSQGIDPDSMYNSLRHCKALRRMIENRQCAYLCRKRSRFTDVLKSFKREDFIVGVFAEYEKFHSGLSEFLGWPETVPPLINSSRGDYGREYLGDSELRALVAEMTVEDQKLHDYLIEEHDGLLISVKDREKRRRRMARLLIGDREEPARSDSAPWIEAGREFWPRARNSELGWPLSDIVVLRAQRLLYTPIPGRINDRILSILFNQSPVPNKQAARKLGLLRVIAHFDTGLLLRDRTPSAARAILEDENYWRFAFVSEPLARVVAAYRAYFVDLSSTVPQSLAAFVAQWPGSGGRGASRGISFRAFVRYVLAGEPDAHEPLLKPQALYLGAESKLYCEALLWQLQEELLVNRKMAGTLIDDPALHQERLARKPEAGGGELADTLPEDFPAGVEINAHRLADEQITAEIRRYYRDDYCLYNRALAQSDENLGR